MSSSSRHPPLDTPPESETGTGTGTPEPGTDTPGTRAATGAGDAVAGGTEAVDTGTGAVDTAKGQTTEVELTRAQHAFARRVAESQATIPHLTLRVEVDLEECLARRGVSPPAAAGPAGRAGIATADAAEGAATAGTGEAPPARTAEIVRACALALREHPRVNSTYRDGRVQMHSRVNVGAAVSVEPGAPGEPEKFGKAGEDGIGGTAVIAPTVFDADTLTTEEIAAQIDDLRARAHAGTLAPPQLSGATFTVVDLGADGVSGTDGLDGVDAVTATIMPGQAAILAVGSIRPRPVATADRRVLARHTAMLTLSCDHRVLHGADAASFLARVRELLEASAVG